MYRFETFDRFGISARISGVADGDCGFNGPNPSEAVENRKRFCAAIGANHEDLVCAGQTHGVTVARAEEPDRGRQWGGDIKPFPSTDAMVTDVPGLPIAIFVADCVPVFLFDERNRAAGLAHAGREGTAARIVERTLDAMRDNFGTRPEDVHAAIGPSAGPCCYEVSEEMAGQWRASGAPVRGRNLDLWETNAAQLSAYGVSKTFIFTARLCTICGEEFYSHRNHADRSRNMALIML
jgi:YfiH family protein